MKWSLKQWILGFIILFLSCNQPLVSQEKFETIDLEVLSRLPSKLRENSGWIRMDSTYYTINDGGNGAFIFKVDPFEGDIQRKIVVEGAKNKDWEEISTDGKSLIVGDFGNNSHKRKDLRFLYFSPSDVDTFFVSKEIEFKYEDQEDYPPKKKKSYDCEAFLAYNDSLVLFTKNYSRKPSSIYFIDPMLMKQKAKLIASYPFDSRITGAAFHPEWNYFILLSYKKNHANSFIHIFLKTGKMDDIQSFKQKTYALPIRAQTESITHIANHQFLITSEKGSSIAARSFKVDLAEKIQALQNGQ